MAQIKKIVNEEAFDLLAKEVYAELAKKAGTSHQHNADSITDSSTKKIPTIAKQAEWDQKATQQQLQAAINSFASGLAWKGVFETLDALNKAITAPKEGYFVIITKEPSYQNKNTLLIYEGESVNAWQTVGELLMPGNATQSTNGLMSKEDKKKLDGLQNYTHPSSHPATMIIEDESHKFVTSAEKANIATALSTANAAKTAAATADGKAVTAQNTADTAKSTADTANSTADTAKSTADSALAKANANEGKINTANGKITELEGKFVYLTTEEAQTIINKYKQA